MAAFYDEIEIEDLDFDEEKKMFFYPCPCGDKFQISLADILDGEEVARCPSCSLIIHVIYDPKDFEGDDEAGTKVEETKAPPIEVA